MLTSPRPMRTFISKQASGFSGTGRMMKRMGYWDTTECPRCSAPEDATHVLQCTHPGASAVWHMEVDLLKASLDLVHTDPQITAAILDGLDTWRYNTIPATSNQLFTHQHTMGWKSFLDGFHSTQWGQAQQRYVSMLGRPFSVSLWSSQLIRWVWQIPWKM
jgi:hypothetical protein